MRARRSALVRLSGILPAFFLFYLFYATLLGATSSAYPIQLKVLSAEYHALDSGTPVPKDCDLQNFSAYCNESRNPTVQNVMVVEDNNGKSFTIACTVDSRFSKCAELPVGETFEARQDKHGITVVYRDAKGKEKKELYQVLAAAPAPQPAVAPQQQPAAAPRSGAVPSPAPPVAARPVLSANSQDVKCNFNSTPLGAEITVDGSYVGNTPSEIAVSPGHHVIVFTLAGFAEWKRELKVGEGSGVVNVTASLQNTQP